MEDYSDDDSGNDGGDVCDMCGTDEGVTEFNDGPSLCPDCFEDWIS